jgi:hypothetical protein
MRRSVFNLRRFRRRLNDLHMGTARMGYTSKALWIFDFSLALAGLQHHSERMERVNISAFYAALDGKGCVIASFFPLSRGSGSASKDIWTWVEMDNKAKISPFF